MRPLLLSAVFLATASMACGSAGDGVEQSGTETATTETTTATATATTTTAPARTPFELAFDAAGDPAGDPVQDVLAGVWYEPGQHARITLEGNDYTIETAQLTATGNIVVNGNVATFFNAEVCPSGPGLRGTGSYEWDTPTSDSVHFVRIGNDPCLRSQYIRNATWSREVDPEAP